MDIGTVNQVDIDQQMRDAYLDYATLRDGRPQPEGELSLQEIGAHRG